MKRGIVSVLALIAVAACGSAPAPLEPWYPALNQHGDPVAAVFESRIPCADCQTIKFALALYRDRAGALQVTGTR